MSDFHRGTRRFDDVEAASFSPEGTDLTVTEDGGDLVAKDDVGNVVLRYDEGSGSWVMDSLNTESINSDHIYAGSHDGTDPDARLDSVLSSVSGGEVIYLERGEYSADRTITTPHTIVGTTGRRASGTVINGVWTFDDRVSISHFQLIGQASITLTTSRSETSNFINFGEPINVNADECVVSNGILGEVIFGSGTELSIVDTCAGISVTDNGTNTVGDIA